VEHEVGVSRTGSKFPRSPGFPRSTCKPPPHSNAAVRHPNVEASNGQTSTNRYAPLNQPPKPPSSTAKMVDMNIVIPCAVLGGICAGMLVFFWWWFPRTWKSGNKQEEEALDMALEATSGGQVRDGLTREERVRIAGQRAKEYLEAVEARNKARAEGRSSDEPLPAYQPPAGGLGNEPPRYVA
jgi:hypothetical protein